MRITLKESDFSKAGWQARRPEQLKGSDMGKTLDAFRPYYKLGGKATYQQGKETLANAAVTALTKAIGNAKVKANAIKDAAVKRQATDLLSAYELEIIEFRSDLGAAKLAAVAQEKKIEEALKKQLAQIQSLKLEDVLKDGDLLAIYRRKKPMAQKTAKNQGEIDKIALDFVKLELTAKAKNDYKAAKEL